MTHPSRQKSQKKVKIQHHSQQDYEEYEDDIPMSQQSMTSSDAGIMAAVAQQMQASKEKKKKEKTKKFFQLAERELDKCITEKSKALRQNVEDMTKLFESFVSSYASSEDDIRKLWVLIGEEQKNLLDLAIRQHTLATSQSLEIEKGQLAGMANVKRACEDFKTQIDELTVKVY